MKYLLIALMICLWIIVSIKAPDFMDDPCLSAGQNSSFREKRIIASNMLIVEIARFEGAQCSGAVMATFTYRFAIKENYLNHLEGQLVSVRVNSLNLNQEIPKYLNRLKIGVVYPILKSGKTIMSER